MKIAVVTGASSGIGRDFARIMDGRGYDCIWLIARRRSRLEELAGELSTPCRIMDLDLTLTESINAYKFTLAADKPEVEVLINCAGFGKFGDYSEIDVAESAKIIDLNARALMMMTELTLPYMKEGSKIIQMSSVSSFVPIPYLNVYAATKAFVTHYARALAVELRPRGITVTAVTPYWMDSEFFERALQSNPQHYPLKFKPIVPTYPVAVKAVKDADSGKEISAYGKAASLRRLTKLLPHKFVIRVYMRGQRK